MGTDCSPSSSALNCSGYSLVQLLDHPAFGVIYHLRNDANGLELAVKKIVCEGDIMEDSFRRKIELAKQYDTNIPTLLHINDYQLLEGGRSRNKALAKIDFREHSLECGGRSQKIILIQFSYFSGETTLSEIIATRIAQLNSFKSSKSPNLALELEEVKLCDYEEIDSLDYTQRQYINIFYQQIEVLRMIDHIVGAIFFLHHFGIKHQAVRPDCIVLDEESKYILLERQIFGKPTNYAQAEELLTEVVKGRTKLTEQKLQKLSYLCPEMLPSLNMAHPYVSGQKQDIFAVGLVALEMCLLEKNQLVDCSQPTRLRFLEAELTRKLVRVKQKYSQQFLQLLLSMLKVTPEERISFSELIDRLNPILTVNLESLRKVHLSESAVDLTYMDKQAAPQSPKDSTEVLKSRLAQIQNRFQHVLASRTLMTDVSFNLLELKRHQQKIISQLANLQIKSNAILKLRNDNIKRLSEQQRQPEAHSMRQVSFTRIVNEPNSLNAPKTVNTLSSMNGPRKMTSSKEKMQAPQQSKRQVSRKDLYEIYCREYEEIKSYRPQV